MNFFEQLTETSLGFYVFLSGFGLVAVWEGLRPLRPPSASTLQRWTHNFFFLVFNTFFLRWLMPASAVGWSVLSLERGWGILPAMNVPPGIGVVLGLLALDLAGYCAHALLHKSVLLWRLHALHHSDLDFDCTTGFRFHPLEALFTFAVMLLVIASVGAPPLAVALLAAWLGLQNLYGHANARFPAAIERVLRWLVVTPDMHRIHHSSRIEESNRNFGVILPWWDRLFRTYQADPLHGHEGMQIGLDWRRREGSLPELFLLPLNAQVLPVRLESD